MKRIHFVLLGFVSSLGLGLGLVSIGHAEEVAKEPGSDVVTVTRVFNSSDEPTKLGRADLDYLKAKFPGMRVLMQGELGFYYLGREISYGHSMYFEVPKQSADNVFKNSFTDDYTVTSFGQKLPLRAVVLVDKSVKSGDVAIPLELFSGGDFPGFPKSAQELIHEYGAASIAKEVEKPGYQKAWFGTTHQPRLSGDEARPWIEVSHRLSLYQQLNWKRSRIVPRSGKK